MTPNSFGKRCTTTRRRRPVVVVWSHHTPTTMPPMAARLPLAWLTLALPLLVLLVAVPPSPTAAASATQPATDAATQINVTAMINQTLVARQTPRTLRIGYMATRSFYGKFVIGGFLAELIMRAANEFWQAQGDQIQVELVYGEASTTTTESASTRCAAVANQLVQEDVHVVIGPPSSACSQPSAAVFGQAGIPQISHSATSQALSDKDTFPTFFRIPPSDARQAKVLAGIAAGCSWSSIGIIATTDAWGQGLVNTLYTELAKQNITVGQQLLLPQGRPLENITAEFQQYKRSSVSSVNILIALREDAIQFVSAAIAVGMTGPGWTWLASDGVATNTGITSDLLEFMAGMVGVQPLSVSGPLSTAFHTFPDSLKYSAYVQDTSIPSFSSRLFDAVSAARIAANTAPHWNGTHADKQRMMLSQLRSFNSVASGIPGASSETIFFDDKQDGPAFYEVVNVVDAAYVRVALVEAGTFAPTNTPVQWADPTRTGFTSCPSQLPPREPVQGGTSDINNSLVIVVALLAVLFVIVTVVSVIAYKRNKVKQTPHDFSEDLKETGLGTDTDVLLPPQELRRNTIKIGEKLGAGHYGQVFKGSLDQSLARGLPHRQVAIKMCHDNATAQDVTSLLKEAAYMAQFKGHVNVVGLVGVVTRGRPVMVVMEFCEHGSLDRYLRTTFQRVQLSFISKLRMGLDVVEGMCFISSKSAIHRDLACRNILVTQDFVCKITDFGLARKETHYTSTSHTVPIKWTAPEALSKGRFSTKSDVWSFGVCMCEIFLNGSSPYPGQSNEAVRVGLTCGYLRHPQVPGMPDNLYAILKKCWAEEPEHRPTFAELRQQLIYLIDDDPALSMLRLQEKAIHSDSVSMNSSRNNLAASMEGRTSRSPSVTENTIETFTAVGITEEADINHDHDDDGEGNDDGGGGGEGDRAGDSDDEHGNCDSTRHATQQQHAHSPAVITIQPDDGIMRTTSPHMSNSGFVAQRPYSDQRADSSFV
ncbi:TK protein kinase [Salpingoeca rosetta]|uniref:TK protein kinase n=1 Tax=Salpingoeca rosetta (strain ATCC 50818 / BSB-021) TaxID=946362 RepID=F2U6Y1_SALR5|nr:TK protein kinase [Salpingoeca rosetta]EGD83613.1 TK protein kinase [Salpingoeca rosetta]|eukprot:XP_004995117.1 TK protein kinase [Salpingoeca rosetta]